MITVDPTLINFSHTEFITRKECAFENGLWSEKNKHLWKGLGLN